MFDTAKVLHSKYGFIKQSLLVDPYPCFDKNGKKQLVNPLDQGIAAGPEGPCAFNALLCNFPGGTQGKVKVNFSQENVEPDI